jgi:hypothetical protein
MLYNSEWKGQKNYLCKINPGGTLSNKKFMANVGLEDVALDAKGSQSVSPSPC